jgi:ATP-dependent DNA helicase Rep
VNAGAVQARISRWKNDLITPEQALEAAEDAFEAAWRVSTDYEQSLRAYNAVDFDDLILGPVRLFRDHPDLREAWQGRIRYLLVDEYQDTNGAQYELVRQLVGPARRPHRGGRRRPVHLRLARCAAGEPGSPQAGLPDPQGHLLEQNYRSSARILGLANGLIAHNPHVFEKRLWSELGPGR